MNISDSMLFRWVGYGIERPQSKHLPAPKRSELDIKADLSNGEFQEYIKYLKAAFDPDKGLAVCGYSKNDAVGNVPPKPVPKPCLFFTEQAAGTSENHWSRYGRLGFGFSKRFIYRCGGRPVIYTTGKNDDPVADAVDSLRKIKNQIPGSANQVEMGRHLEVLARYIKCTKIPGPKKEEPKRQKRNRTIPSEYQWCDFPNHNPIQFLGEREWRLLVDESEKRFVRAEKNNHEIEWWFRPEIGRELQVIVVPNNYFIKVAMECESIRTRLLGKGKHDKPIQLISAQALQKL